MDRPQVVLSNSQETYGYYDELEPEPRIVRLGHSVVSKAFKPEVHYAEGADVEVNDALADEKRLFLASNHLYVEDPPVLASLLKREEVFNPMMGKTNILAFAKLFTQSRVLRVLLDGLGALPVFRDLELPKADAVFSAEEIKRQQESAKTLLIDVVARKVTTKGNHIAIFPEGDTNKKGSPREVQKLKRGIGDMYIESGEETPKAIVPIGLLYRQVRTARSLFLKTKPGKRKPILYVGNLLQQHFDGSEDVVDQTQSSMQKALDAAFEIHDTNSKSTGRLSRFLPRAKDEIR